MHPHPIRAVVFDIDGTLAMMDKETGTYEALPGATEALAACRDAALPVVAYTNGTFFPPGHYYPRLAAAGLEIAPGHILTPATVAALYLRQSGYRRVMVLGGEGTRQPVAEAGIEVVAPGADAGKVEAVLLGYTRDFGVPELEAICNAVWDGAAPFTCSDAPFVASSKGRILGISGAVSAIIQKVSGKTPMVMGKPSTLGLEMMARLTGVPATEMVVIGDDPGLEIQMARKAGALAVGVTTGISGAAEFAAAAPDLRAHIVLPGLVGLAEKDWFPGSVANRAAQRKGA